MGRALLIFRWDIAKFAGSERVFAYMVRVLKELNYSTVVLTFGGKWDDNFTQPDVFRSIPGPNGGRLSRFVKNLYSLIYEYYHKVKDDFDVVIDAAYNDLRGWVDLGYVHYPYCTAHLRFLFPMKARVVAANSTWTLSKLKDCGVNNAVVIYPPVEPVKCGYNSLQFKEDMVIGIGRLGKPWEEFIEIAKLVKAERPGVKFVIIGFADSVERVKHLEDLSRGIVKIIPNASEEIKRDLLCRAKVILHTHPAEHFGIAVVEAMSVGAIPVVHRDGGVWLDVVERGRFGFGFDNVEEAAEFVINAVDADTEYRKLVMSKAFEFNYDRFKNALISNLQLVG
jgi:glycosyltransferase involved in cell wall biosynthesis